MALTSRGLGDGNLIVLITGVLATFKAPFPTKNRPAPDSNTPKAFSCGVFSGSVAGDHISPISETTIMATTSSGCYMMDHVYTQLPYGTIALISTGISFLVVGLMPCTNYWLSVGVSMGTGLAISFISLVVLNKMWKNKAK